MGLLDQSLYSVTFDAATVGRIAALMNTEAAFATYYTAAMCFSVNLVNSKAQANAPVRVSGGGTLRRGIRGYVRTPWLGEVGVIRNVPYARRRELGFDQRTDSLGRFYPMDPKSADKRAKMHYLRRALEDSRPAIGAAYRTATQMAIRSIVV
jgi:hypothetical protein